MFHGTITALITPYTLSNTLDLSSYASLVEWQITAGIDGIVVAGTTGEGWALSDDEKIALLKCAVDVAKGRIPVIFSSGTPSTAGTVLLTERAKKEGADGCLVTFPYYNRPTEEGCICHFQEAARVGLPIISYYHPGRTGLRLNIDALERVSRVRGVVAMKDSSCDPQLLQELLKRVEIGILSGDDKSALEAISKGAKGVISVISNAFPSDWTRPEIRELIEALDLETNPQPIKYVMSLLGKCLPDLRLPLVLPKEKTRQRLSQLVDQALATVPVHY